MRAIKISLVKKEGSKEGEGWGTEDERLNVPGQMDI